MVGRLDQRVQRGHYYAIIDEVDSILIDEARTPLIISGAVGAESDVKYAQFNAQVVQLVRKQTAIANDLIGKAEPLLADEKTQYDGARLLYQAQLGMPKNKKLLKLLQRAGHQDARAAGGARSPRRPQAAGARAEDARRRG